MKIIIKKPDQGIIIIHPNEAIYGDGKIPYSEEIALKEYIAQGFGWFLCPDDQFPSKEDLESRKQLYHDENTIKKDLSWERQLMPVHLIKEKHLKKCNRQIDDELSEENPNVMKVFTLQRHKEICLKNSELEWHQQALINLDERMQNGEEDKPIIRGKLLERINGKNP